MLAHYLWPWANIRPALGQLSLIAIRKAEIYFNFKEKDKINIIFSRININVLFNFSRFIWMPM